MARDTLTWRDDTVSIHDCHSSFPLVVFLHALLVALDCCGGKLVLAGHRRGQEHLGHWQVWRLMMGFAEVEGQGGLHVDVFELGISS
jgi:hypothetical protein